MPEPSPASSISTAPDDARRRPTSGGRPRPSGSSSGGGGGRSIAINLVVAALVAGLGVAGWFIANQHQLLIEEQRKAAEADGRLHALEERLRMTDQVMSETEAETDEEINFWESEVRKLWAVTNERNKKWIQDNQKLLQTQKNAIASLQSSDRTLKSAVDRHDKAFNQQQALIDQLASIELQLQQVLRGQRDLVDRVNAATQTAAAQNSRVAENEQAIAAIDAYRVQVNTRLSSIESQLRTLAARPEPPPTL